MSFVMHGGQILLDGRRIGWITKIGDKIVFVSPRRELPHKMRIYGGYGISETVLNWLKEHDVDEVHLRIGDRRILMVSVDLWLEKSIKNKFPPFEEQMFLQEKHFKESKRTLAELTP